MTEFHINEMVKYKGNGSLTFREGTMGIVKAFTNFGDKQFLKVDGFGENAYPAEWFEPAAVIPGAVNVKIDLYNFGFNVDALLAQIVQLGEWEVRKRIHADLDRAIDAVKAQKVDPPKKLPPEHGAL